MSFLLWNIRQPFVLYFVFARRVFNLFEASRVTSIWILKKPEAYQSFIVEQ